ncbi:MAG: dihydropyrimidinase [Oscillospiraceae bacterium]|nr:dihydropyrimidinase [Oscillospiraceae bacterium]
MNIIQNGLLVTPEGPVQADLAFENGIITALGQIQPRGGDRALDAAGCWVFPGFIDQHTHLQANTGITWTADDFASGTTAAVCGGTTTIVDFATQDRGMTLMEALNSWKERALGNSRCNVAFHMAVSDWNGETKKEIPLLRQEGVSSFKAYLAYDHLRLKDTELLELLETLRDHGCICGCHCENGPVIARLQEKEIALGHAGPAGHPRSRPPETEAEAVNRFAYLAALARCPVYVVHLSTRLGLEEVRAARRRGQTIYAETCPQYLLLEDAVYDLPGFEGAKYVCSPPIRKREDVSALREALLAGEIEAVATDHCAFRFDTQKSLGKEDFRKIPNGIPGIEHRPALTAEVLRQEGALTPVRMNAVLSEGPAKLMGMYPRKGALKVGSDADLTVWQPDTKWTIRAAEQHQNVDYSPYEGFKVCGRARQVYVNGIPAAENGEPTEAVAGKFVKR